MNLKAGLENFKHTLRSFHKTIKLIMLDAELKKKNVIFASFALEYQKYFL